MNESAKADAKPSENIVSFSPEDVAMETAIRQAKTSFRQFMEAFWQPTERQKSFLVKVVFDEGNKREHMWLADLDFQAVNPAVSWLLSRSCRA